MRVLVCGDRLWRDSHMVHAHLSSLKAELGTFTVVEGGATGADVEAANAARHLDLPVETFKADWIKYGRAAGPRRNRQMLDTKPDLVLAFHDDIEHSRGTKDCVGEARRRGIAVRVVSHARAERADMSDLPDGRRGAQRGLSGPPLLWESGDLSGDHAGPEVLR